MSGDTGRLLPGIELLQPEDLRYLVESSLDGIVIVDEERRFVYVNPAMLAMSGYTAEELLGRDLLTVIAPGYRDEMLAWISASLAGEPGRRSLVILRADGVERDIEYTSMALLVHGRPHIAAIVRDVTEERRLIRETEALAQIAANLTLDRTLDERLDAVARVVVESTGAAGCAVLIMSGDPPELKRLRVYGLPDQFAELMIEDWQAARDADLPAFQAYRRQETLVVPDLSEVVRARSLFLAYDTMIEEIALGGTVASPLVYRERSMGTLMSYFPAGIVPDTDQVRFLRAIADQAAVVVENVRLFQEARRSAALEERHRLARELHDSVSQALYGIVLGARTARAMLEREPEKVGEPLDYVLSLADAGLREMRALIFELRPDALETEGLVPAIERHAEAWRARYGIDIATDLPPEPEIPPADREAVYRIIQEAALNAIKHASASRIEIRVSAGPDALVALVADNGRGFDAAGSFPGHLGLTSMQERAASSGGTLAIESAPGEGTRVIAQIPLKRAEPVVDQG